MRILMLTQSYPPVVGGEERAVEDLSGELAARGHDVTVATLRQPGGEPRDGEAGVRVHAMRSSVYRLRRLYGDPDRRHAPPAPDPETVLELRRLLRQERPDVIHAHNWLVHSYLPLDRGTGAALVLSLHDYGLRCATRRMLHKGAPCSGPSPVKCVRCAAGHYGLATGFATALGTGLGGSRLRSHVDLFLPISGAVGDQCGLGPDDAFRVIPNFFREMPASPDPEDPRLAELPDVPFLLFFGDATVDKGAALLAEAYAGLERPPPLVFLGRRMVDGLGELPGVTVLGPWPQELVMEAVRRCLFAVVPSIWPEPFGLVALEAAAAGKPVVASRIGGLLDIVIDGETGLLVAPGDPESLRAGLAQLIADPGLREGLGAGASRRAESFSAGVVVPAFEDAYRVAVERRRGILTDAGEPGSG
jgi:glycosyltransferase involved in cell wall biosynthesis